MHYIYSKHILIRMQERNILEEEIDLLLSGDIDIVVIPSKTDKMVELILGCVFNRWIALILNKKTYKLITVRQMRDNEKKLYKKVKNEKTK